MECNLEKESVRETRERKRSVEERKEKTNSVQSSVLTLEAREELNLKQEKMVAANAALHWELLLLADGNPFREAAEGKKRLWSVPADPPRRQVRDKTVLQRRVTFRRGGNNWLPPPYSTHCLYLGLLYLDCSTLLDWGIPTGQLPFTVAACGWSGGREERAPLEGTLTRCVVIREKRWKW